MLRETNRLKSALEPGLMTRLGGNVQGKSAKLLEDGECGSQQSLITQFADIVHTSDVTN